MSVVLCYQDCDNLLWMMLKKTNSLKIHILLLHKTNKTYFEIGNISYNYFHKNKKGI